MPRRQAVPMSQISSSTLEVNLIDRQGPVEGLYVVGESISPMTDLRGCALLAFP